MSGEVAADGSYPGRGSSLAMRLAAGAVFLAGFCYSAWILETVLNTGVNPVNSFLSELFAEGKPHRRIFIAADELAGAMAMLAALCGFAGRPRRPYTTLGWTALLCFGAATIADSLMPLRQCPPGRICAAGRTLFPQLHQPHALTSTIAVSSIAVAAIVLTESAYRHRRWPAVRTAGFAALAIGVAATLWMLVGNNLSGHYALGIAHRVQVGSISLWLTAFGFALARENRRGRGAVE